PDWIGSRKLRHRRSVLFPDPLGPMITTTSPRVTARLTSFSTWSDPKCLCTWLTLTTEPQPPLRVEGQARQRVAEHEVQRGDDPKDLEREERLLHQDLAGPRQLHVAQDGHDRGVLDESDQEPDPGRDHDLDRGRQDDVAHDLAVPHPEAPGGRPL